MNEKSRNLYVTISFNQILNLLYKISITDKPFNNTSSKSKEISKQVQTSWNTNTETLLSLVNTDLVFGSAGNREAKTCHSSDGWDRTDSHGCCPACCRATTASPPKTAQSLVYTLYHIPYLTFLPNNCLEIRKILTLKKALIDVYYYFVLLGCLRKRSAIVSGIFLL